MDFSSTVECTVVLRWNAALELSAYQLRTILERDCCSESVVNIKIAKKDYGTAAYLTLRNAEAARKLREATSSNKDYFSSLAHIAPHAIFPGEKVQHQKQPQEVIRRLRAHSVDQDLSDDELIRNAGNFLLATQNTEAASTSEQRTEKDGELRVTCVCRCLVRTCAILEVSRAIQHTKELEAPAFKLSAHRVQLNKIQLFNALSASKTNDRHAELQRVKTRVESLTGRRFLYAYASLDLPSVAILESADNSSGHSTLPDGDTTEEKAASSSWVAFEYDQLVGVSLPCRYKTIQPSQLDGQCSSAVTVTFRVPLRELVKDENVVRVLETRQTEAEKLCAKLTRQAHFAVAFQPQAAQAKGKLNNDSDSYFIVTLCYADADVDTRTASTGADSEKLIVSPISADCAHFSLLDHRDAACRQIEAEINTRYARSVKLQLPKLSYYDFLEDRLPQSGLLRKVRERGCIVVLNCQRFSAPQNVTLVGRCSQRKTDSRLDVLAVEYNSLMQKQKVGVGVMSALRAFWTTRKYALVENEQQLQSEGDVCLRMDDVSELELALLVQHGALERILVEDCQSLVSASYKRSLSRTLSEQCTLRLFGSLRNVLFAQQQVAAYLNQSAMQVIRSSTKLGATLLNGAVVKLLCNEKARRALGDRLKLDGNELVYSVNANSITLRSAINDQRSMDKTLELVANAWISVFHVGPVANAQLRLLHTTKWTYLLESLRWRMREDFALFFAVTKVCDSDQSQLSFASLFFEARKIEKDVAQFFSHHRVLNDADLPINPVYADVLRTFASVRQNFEALQATLNSKETCLPFSATLGDRPATEKSERATLRVRGCSCDWAIFERLFNMSMASLLKYHTAGDLPGMRTLLAQDANSQFVEEVEHAMQCLVFVLPSSVTTNVQLASLQTAERCTQLARSRSRAQVDAADELHQPVAPLFEAAYANLSFCVVHTDIDEYPHELRVVFVESSNDALRFEAVDDGRLLIAYLDASAALTGSADSARRTFVTLLRVAATNELDSVCFSLVKKPRRWPSEPHASLQLAQRVLDAVRSVSVVADDSQLPTFDSIRRIAFVAALQSEALSMRRAVQRSLCTMHIAKSERSGLRAALFAPETTPSTAAPASSLPASTSATTSKVQLRIVRGDIIQDDADAIVNSTNENLNMSGMVAKMLLKNGGAKLEEAVRAIARLNDGIAVTSGHFGSLKCKHIVHVNAPESPNSCRDLIRRCIAKADELRCASIAIPAIGTGVRALERDSVAPAIIEGVMSTNTKMDVRLVLFDEPTHKLFLDAFRNYSNTSTPSTPASAPAKAPIPVPKIEERVQETRDSNVKLERRSGARFYQSAVLLVVALEERACRDVVTRIIERLRKETIVRETVREKQARSMLKTERSVLDWFAKRNQVDILEWNVSAGRLELCGKQQQLSSFKSEVLEALIDMNERRSARELQRAVRWEYAEQAGVGIGTKADRKLTYLAYDLLANQQIEEAHKDAKGTVEIDRVEDDGNTVRFCLNLKSKVDSRKDDPAVARCRRLRRVDLTRTRSQNQADLPIEWDLSSEEDSESETEGGKQSQLLKMRLLQATDPEYVEIENDFRKQLPGSRVLRIQRIQNVTLYRQYAAQKQRMEAKYGSQTRTKLVEIERLLYHGTKEDVASKVQTHGFDRGYAGNNVGAIWGQGVYFASSIAYSAQTGYAVPNSRGEKHIFVCAVLIGETVVGNGNMKVLPPNPRSSVYNDIYDTATDNQTPPTIFVKFHDAHVYPKYLVKFK